LLIAEATYTEEDKELAEEHRHLTARQAAEIAKKSQAKKLVLTHISQRYDGREKIILDEARKVFPKTEIAEDFDKIEI